MKSVLIAIRPKWVEKIASGEKTIEVRKSAPQEVPFKAYIYCCKGNNGYEWLYRVDDNGHGKAQSWHGKVIGEFICDRIIEWKYLPDCEYDGEKMYYIESKDGENTCLLYYEIEEYGKGKTLYGWRISDLKIYDRPRELSEFYVRKFDNRDYCSGCVHHENPVTEYPCNECRRDAFERQYLYRPPQSWQYVEDLGEE